MSLNGSKSYCIHRTYESTTFNVWANELKVKCMNTDIMPMNDVLYWEKTKNNSNNNIWLIEWEVKLYKMDTRVTDNTALKKTFHT